MVFINLERLSFLASGWREFQILATVYEKELFLQLVQRYLQMNSLRSWKVLCKSMAGNNCYVLTVTSSQGKLQLFTRHEAQLTLLVMAKYGQ